MTDPAAVLDTSTSVTIRPMQITDLEQVLSIDQNSFNVPWPKSAYIYELTENQKSMVLVAELAHLPYTHRIVGMIVVWLIVDEAHIATLAVHPGYRRRGVAKELITAGLRDAQKKGAVEATLEVRKSNKVAQELYRCFQFEIAGRRPRYYRDNHEDAVIMTVKGLDDDYFSDLVLCQT